MTNGYDGLDDERDGRVFDLHPAGPGGDLPWRVRRAQVIQTLTESAGDPYGYDYAHRRRGGLTDDASPQLRTVAAVFWPVALLVAIEVLARVAWPAGGRWLLVRFGGLGPVATVAAVVSYRHLSGLLSFYGEDAITATVGPLAVDGLMVMATGALLATRPGGVDLRPAPGGKRTAVATASAAAAAADSKSRASGRRVRTDTRGADTAAVRVDTAARVAALRASHPDMATADIASRLGVSDRTVRRHLARDLAAPRTDMHIAEEVSA